jgi:hypothetical protein
MSAKAVIKMTGVAGLISRIRRNTSCPLVSLAK